MSKWKILVNDGMHPKGIQMLQDAGFDVDTNNIPNEELPSKLNAYDVICVRSATKVREPLMDAAPNLKMIVRGGVGLDNIDLQAAAQRGIKVANTPGASTQSVAELVMAHFLTLARSLHLSNRQMPTKGTTEFKTLKKNYSKGIELHGKKLGIVGCGRIGRALASLAVRMGMEVIPVDVFETLELDVHIAGRMIPMDIPVVSLDEMLSEADFISLHVPALERPLIDAAAFAKMKPNAIIVNAARGGVIDESALLAALDNGQIRGAGLDVFVGEPTPNQALLDHPNISVTPHTGASTGEAQERIGIEIAEQIIAAYSDAGE